FKSVNPDEFKLILEESSQRYTHAIVLFATGMGDLIIWSDGCVRLLNYRHGIIKTIMYTFEFFFQNMNDLEFIYEDLSWQTYSEALKQYNELKYYECSCYTTVLGLGGVEEVKNLRKVKLKEHIFMITEVMGPLK